MTLTEILLIGVGLAMDAVAVSMTNGMVYKNLGVREYLAMPVFFGVFQALMPLIGSFAGDLFAEIIYKYAGAVILVILGVIGGKMISEGLAHMKAPRLQQECGGLTGAVLIFQGVATSIDAFAVGVGFSAVRVDIVLAVAVIGIVTAFLTGAALAVGRKCGDILGCPAEILGGGILIIIGIKAIIK